MMTHEDFKHDVRCLLDDPELSHLEMYKQISEICDLYSYERMMEITITPIDDPEDPVKKVLLFGVKNR